MASLKAGIAGVFAVLHPPEEPLVGFLQAKQDILQDMRSNVLVLWPEHFLDLHQIALLFVDADGMLFRELLARRLNSVLVRFAAHGCRFLVRGKRATVCPFPMASYVIFYASCKTVVGYAVFSSTPV